MRYKFLLILIPIILSADDRLRLIRADVLENVNRNGTAVQILTGDVIFQKGELILSCDVANYTEKTGQGFLIGNAKAKKDSSFITADTLHFNSPNNILTASGNACAWDSKYNLTAKKIIYNTKIDSGMAGGNAKMLQNKQVVTADTLTYFKPHENEGANYTAFGNVKITNNDRLITCGRTSYNLQTEIAHLTLNPVVTSNQEHLSGTELFAHYNEDDLQEIIIPSGAKAYSIHNDKTIGQYRDDMSGKTLKAYFIEGQLDSVRLEGMATTLYHVFNDTIFQGKNVASGDTISLKFAEQEINEILAIGGARGTYLPDTTTSKLETEIKYVADKIDYQISEETSQLIGNAKVVYDDLTLTAGYIGVDWLTNILEALPKLASDSSANSIKPTLNEIGQEPIIGDELVYNLQTERGKILHSKTKSEDGYYRSSVIRNENKDVFYLKQSTYTTCDLDNPHFHFGSPKMKMLQDDKVIAKPITLYLAQIPIVRLPFIVLPMQSDGRQSGWIMPTYGTSNSRGHFLDGFGYYWAINDYSDTKLVASFADLQGITLKSTNRYNKRYKFSGNLQLETRQYLASGENNISNIFGPRQKDYVIKWSHNQILRKNQTFTVNASYYSNSNYNYLTSLNPVKRMNQQAVSNATYSKRWPKSNNSISINFSSKTDLMADRKINIGSDFYQSPIVAETKLSITSITFPIISFRHGQRPLFPTTALKKAWYNNITWNYSSNFNNKYQTYYESVENDTTTGQFKWKTDSAGDGIKHSSSDKILTHTLSFSVPQKFFRNITINPRLSIKSDWVDEYSVAQIDSTGTYESIKKKSFAARTIGSFSLNMGTQLYGLFPIKFFQFNGIRHVASPSIGYSFSPDFSQSLFGYNFNYFESVSDISNSEILHDKFRGTLAGSTPQSERQALTFSLNNVFQTKFAEGDSERKIDLLSWRLSTNYNFAADKFKLSNLTSSIRTGLSKSLKLDISLTHDFYNFDSDNATRLNSINRKNNIPIPRLINARIGTGFRFSGKSIRFADSPISKSVVDTANIDVLDDFGQNLDVKQNPKPISGGHLWNTNVSLSYSYNAANPLNIVKTFWMNTNTTMQITPNWQIQHNARMDLVNQSLVSQSFSIYRDLHCWEMSVSWTPGGYGQGVYLRINVKSPTLKDLKIEERGGIFQNRPQF